jgi:hypothetical protein
VTPCTAAVTSDVVGAAVVTVETAVVTTWFTVGGAAIGSCAGGATGAGGGDAGTPGGGADCTLIWAGRAVGPAGVRGAGAAVAFGAERAIAVVLRVELRPSRGCLVCVAVAAATCEYASAFPRSTTRSATTGVSVLSLAIPGTRSLSPGTSRASQSSTTPPTAARARTPRARWGVCRFVRATASAGGVDAVTAVTAILGAGCSLGEAEEER